MSFNRRAPTDRNSRGRISAGGGASVFTPMALSPTLWLRADMGITLNGAVVAAWADQSGNARDYVQANPALQPNFVASDSDLNSQSAVRFNVVSSFLRCTAAMPLGWVAIVCTYPSGVFDSPPIATLYMNEGGGVADDFIFRGSIGPTTDWLTGSMRAGTRYRDGILTDTALTVANAPHNYEFVASVPATESNYTLGVDFGNSGRYWNDSVAEVVVCATDPSGALKTQWRAYCTARYGTP